MTAKERVLDTVRTKSGLTGKEIKRRANVGSGAVYLILEELARDKVVVSVGDGPQRRWLLRVA